MKISTVLVFILDNVSKMNEFDWTFFKELVQNENPNFLNLVIILNIDKDSRFIKPREEKKVSNLDYIISSNAS